MSLPCDVDRGWAFAVALAFFHVNVLTLGVTWSAAVFYTIFLEEFDASPILTAWTVNLNCFTTHVFGELANYLIDRFGPRATLVIGCLLSCAGYVISSLAPSIQWVLFGFGILTGTGCSLCYMASLKVVTQYFDKYRLNAVMFSSIGVSVGVFAVAPLLDFLSNVFHWRGAFVIFCGIHLNLLVVAAVMMPPRGAEPSDLSKGKRSSLMLFLDNAKVLLNCRFCLYIVIILMICVGCKGFNTHITKFAILRGHSHTTANFLVSILGLAGILSRTAWAAMTKLSSAHAVIMYAVFLTLLGVSTMACGTCVSYVSFAFGMAAVGVFLSGLGCVTEVIVYILGVSRSLAGMSYINIFASFGFLAGGPLAAWLYELDPSYLCSFLTSGAICAVGGLLTFALCLKFESGKLRLMAPVDDEKDSKEKPGNSSQNL